MGLAALLLALCLLLASYAILAASDGIAVATWQFAPNVYRTYSYIVRSWRRAATALGSVTVGTVTKVALSTL